MKMYLNSSSLTLPVRFASAEMDPIKFSFVSKANDKPFFELEINNPLRITGWDSTVFDLKEVGIFFPDPENTRDFIKSLVSFYNDDDTTENENFEHPPFHVAIEGKTRVVVCGIPIPNKVDFHRDQELEFVSMFNWIGNLPFSLFYLILNF